MNRFAVESRCECQARLSAILDEKHHVLEAAAQRHGDREIAPGHSINAELERFDVAWMCPFCGRNTLRTFDAGGLRPVGPDAAKQGSSAGSAAPR